MESASLAIVKGKLSWESALQAGRACVVTTSMIFAIVFAASLFALTFRGFVGEHMVAQALSDMPGGATGALFVVMAIMFILGFFWIHLK